MIRGVVYGVVPVSRAAVTGVPVADRAASIPPSTASVCPWQYDASSLASHATAWATSSGVPGIHRASGDGDGTRWNDWESGNSDQELDENADCGGDQGCGGELVPDISF
jgi:hypothetical protein